MGHLDGDYFARLPRLILFESTTADVATGEALNGRTCMVRLSRSTHVWLSVCYHAEPAKSAVLSQSRDECRGQATERSQEFAGTKPSESE
jgi:hypothetical protein